MKNLSLLVMLVSTGLLSFAQEQSPLPKISKQMGDYFAAFLNEKIYVTTDKSLYRPGETVWFRAFVTDWNHQSVGKESGEIFVKLYDSKDKISVSGQQNELSVLLRDLSGEVQKNTALRYQLKNGENVIDKGKVKTDAEGKLTIPSKGGLPRQLCWMSI